ncbi:hypothetical protein [Synechococcus sp. UW140]|uniref:hypothetical protein n=1 Tax=Synechococcus sp. UW140 TaxID=368503 RepID=UPI0031383E51
MHKKENEKSNKKDAGIKIVGEIFSLANKLINLMLTKISTNIKTADDVNGTIHADEAVLLKALTLAEKADEDNAATRYLQKDNNEKLFLTKIDESKPK